MKFTNWIKTFLGFNKPTESTLTLDIVKEYNPSKARKHRADMAERRRNAIEHEIAGIRELREHKEALKQAKINNDILKDVAEWVEQDNKQYATED